MNKEIVNRLHLRYRYGFDENGFYIGLVRPNSLGLFPTNCTTSEPPWIPGRLPVWNFEVGTWVPVMRNERRVIETNLDFLRYHGEKYRSSIVRLLNEDLKTIHDSMHGVHVRFEKTSNLISKQSMEIIKLTHTIHNLGREIELNNAQNVAFSKQLVAMSLQLRELKENSWSYRWKMFWAKISSFRFWK